MNVGSLSILKFSVLLQNGSKGGSKKYRVKPTVGYRFELSLWHNRSMVNENNSHDAGCVLRDAGCEGMESPVFTGGLARLSEGAGQVEEVQSPKSKVPSRIVRKAEFEGLRSKTIFRQEHGMENGKWRARTRAKNRNDGGMAIGALCLIVPPDGSGRFGSPGKTLRKAKKG
jgi:hypothetical protein